MDTIKETSDLAFNVLTVLGTAAFAVSGGMAAGRARMDWFGVVVLGAIVAIGGGTLRDLLLSEPVFWIKEPWPVFVAVGVALLTIPVAKRWSASVDNWNTVLAADALGLGVFTILGVDIALSAGTSEVTAVILGVIAGIGGGIFRDVLVGRKPIVLTGEIYATAAFVGAVIYVFLLQTSISPIAALWIPVIVIFGLRAIALLRGWSLRELDFDSTRDG